MSACRKHWSPKRAQCTLRLSGLICCCCCCWVLQVRYASCVSARSFIQWLGPDRDTVLPVLLLPPMSHASSGARVAGWGAVFPNTFSHDMQAGLGPPYHLCTHGRMRVCVCACTVHLCLSPRAAAPGPAPPCLSVARHAVRAVSRQGHWRWCLGSQCLMVLDGDGSGGTHSCGTLVGAYPHTYTRRLPTRCVVWPVPVAFAAPPPLALIGSPCIAIPFTVRPCTAQVLRTLKRGCGCTHSRRGSG